jgi:hypothetical protein
MILVVVKLQSEFLHHWPECPLEDVSFLRNAHRHVLHITAKKLVHHADRQVEIITLKRQIQSLMKVIFPPDVLVRQSCEDVATALVRAFSLHSCEVLEDGENGAEVFA